MKFYTFVSIFVFIIGTCVKQSDEGFLFGAPCSVINTIEITTKGARFPRNPVQCVDITASGTTSMLPYLYLLENGTTLYADNMLLQRIPRLVIKAMPQLQLIDVSRNAIRKIHQRALLKHADLQTLLLASNKVLIHRTLPFLFSSSLRTLQLSDNKISRLTGNTFSELPSLAVLYLDNNAIRKIHPDVFKPLNNLKYLHLGNNLIKVMPEKRLMPPTLITYIVKGNPLNYTIIK